MAGAGRFATPIRRWRTLAADSSLAASLGGGGKSPQPRPSGFPRIKREGATGPMRHGLGASAPARCRLVAAPGGVFRPICGGSVAYGSRSSSQLGSDFAHHPRPFRLHLRSLAPPRPLQSMLRIWHSSNPRDHTRWVQQPITDTSAIPCEVRSTDGGEAAAHGLARGPRIPYNSP